MERAIVRERTFGASGGAKARRRGGRPIRMTAAKLDAATMELPLFDGCAGGSSSRSRGERSLVRPNVRSDH